MTGFFSRHAFHTAIIAIPFLAIVVMLGPEIYRKRRDTHPRTERAESWSRPGGRSAGNGWLYLIAAGTLGAAAVHASIAREHLHESWIYGTFFVLAALTQVAYAALVVLRPSRRVVAAGLVGNAAVIALWATTRFIAIPLGPDAGTRESVDVLDVLATSFEAVAVLAAVLAFRRLAQPEPVRRLLPSLPTQRVGSVPTLPSNVRIFTKT